MNEKAAYLLYAAWVVIYLYYFFGMVEFLFQSPNRDSILGNDDEI